MGANNTVLEELRDRMRGSLMRLKTFGFWLKNVQKAANNFNTSKLKAQLARLLVEIRQSKGKIVLSERLNIQLDKKAFRGSCRPYYLLIIDCPVTSIEVLDIILDEIRTKPIVANLHGVDLNTALIEPLQQEYKNARDRSQSFILWTVLEEYIDGTGYNIFYD